jgi:phosphoglycolate phosphatase
MWVTWIRELARRLEDASGRAMSGDLFATVGFDPSTNHVSPGSPLAGATMAELRDITAAVLRRWCPSVAAARRATDAAWFTPDPADGGVPSTDLPGLFADLRAAGRTLAVATTDDRHPTDTALRSLQIREHIAAMVCGDDGFKSKPAPDAVLAICQATRTHPSRTAVVGDAPADIEMGRAAGAALVIGVLSGVGRATDLVGADVLVGSIADLRPVRA